jgi:DNA-directed RNA polymerase specialized sigma24 family protein
MTAEEHILTERVLRYQRTREGLEELLAVLAGKIYGYPRCRGSVSEDDGGEFFLFFYPRLLRTLERFEDQGRPFEWYLHSVLRWHYLGFVRWKRRRERSWASGAMPELWEPPAAGRATEDGIESRAIPEWLPPEVAAVFRLDPRGRLRKPADRKRLLIWALKQVRLLREPDLDQVTEWTGIGGERLRLVCAELRDRLERRERRLGLLVERRNRAFAALQLTERTLAGEPDPAVQALLSERLARARRCLHRSQERIARVPLQPSNRELAQALGLPKGTVDTSLYWLKRRLAETARAEAA